MGEQGRTARPLRLLMISPIVLPEPVQRRRAARLAELAGDDLQIELAPLPERGPRGLDTDEQVHEAGELVAAIARRADPERVDLVVPDCVLDPGIDLVEGSEVPVVGLLRLTASALHGLGVAFSAVTRNQAIADELSRRLAQYGLADGFRGVDVLNFRVEMVSQHAEWMRALERVVRQRAATGTTTVFNGCSAVDAESGLGWGGWVVDPTTYALDLLRASWRAGCVPDVAGVGGLGLSVLPPGH